MNSASREGTPNFQGKLRLSLETGDGTVINLEEPLEGTLSGSDASRFWNRGKFILEHQLMPRFLKELRDWVEEQLPEEMDDFEDECARRCDRNDQVIGALEWMRPHIDTDEEREWRDRMLDIHMARLANGELR